MPSTLCHQHGWKRKPMSPVFFAPTDIQPGGLTDELQDRLRASRHLIVICSPNSAQSEWVGKEISYFHGLGRTERIHFFIVKGEPHSGNPQTECFNPVIETLGLPEILGANIHEKIYRWPWLNRERAFIQLVSKLLGVEYDTIWQRHRRRLIVNAINWTIGILAVLATILGVWIKNQPFDTHIKLQETTVENQQLPPLHDAVVTMILADETKTDTINSISEEGLILQIPHSFLGERVQISFSCPDYLSIDTVMTLKRNMVLPIRRDSAPYGTINFTLWDANREQTVANTPITIGTITTTSDSNGRVVLSIPLEKQQMVYPLSCTRTLIDTELGMPHTESTVVCIE